MIIQGGPAILKISGMKAKIELEAYQLGYDLGEAGIALESPEGMKATGHLITKLIMEGMAEFLVGRCLEAVLTDNDLYHVLVPEEQEAMNEIRQEVYTQVVRRGIEALGET